MEYNITSIFEIETYPDYTNPDGTENTGYDYQTKYFSVPEPWAMGWIKKWCADNEFEEDDYYETFRGEYTWDDTLQMYEDACSEGVLLEEHIEARGSSAVQFNEETDEENEYPKLCGFVWCHGHCDFSAYETDLTPEDREAIEQILMKYETKGSSIRNCYASKFSDVFCEVY